MARVTAHLRFGPDACGDGPGHARVAVRGSAALAVLEEEWTPDTEALMWAGARLSEAWEDDERPVLRRAGARWTVVGAETQLRLGEDGRWWPYLKSGARWSPAGPPDRDPATALATALAAGPTGAGG